MLKPLQRLPLAPKIVLLLAVNVVLVGAVFTALLALQVRINARWLLATGAGDRVQVLAQALANDLTLTAKEDLPALLGRYAEEYGLPFYLFGEGGQPLAGPPVILPREVLRAVQRARGAGPGRGFRAGRLGIRPQGPPDRPPWAPARGTFFGPQPFDREVFRTGSPPAYWVIVRLPPAEEARPVTLVLRAASVFSGGLLFDPKPWLLAGLATLGISVACWLPFIRGLGRDILRMNRQTEAIADGHFEARLNLRRGDELGRLAEAIDRMAGRLADQVASQRRFLGDAAHELCSPLARMQAAVALLEDRKEAEPARYLADLREELDEMAALVDELLSFSRATHGRRLDFEPIRLRELVDRTWSRESRPDVLFENRVPDDLQVLSDRPLLTRALANLFRNALRHAAASGPIEVTAEAQDESVLVRVADVGPGVPDEALTHLFEAFYRPEPSRNRDQGGAGLGLAIVKTCVEACRGTVSARNREPRGFEVRMTLLRAMPENVT